MDAGHVGKCTCTKKQALARYDMGVEAAERQADASYRDGAIADLAREKGLTVVSLYSYIKVANTWSRAQFQALLAHKNAKGIPLSFSHIQELAHKGHRYKREEHLHRALHECLSLHALKELRHEGSEYTLCIERHRLLCRRERIRGKLRQLEAILHSIENSLAKWEIAVQ